MNKVILCGRLTRDPEIRYTQGTPGENPTAVARYTLAVDRKYSKGEEKQADFISCVAFGKAGEFVEKYLKKGTKILITGRIQTGNYIDKETGKKVYTTDVIAEEHEFVESKKEEGHTEAPEDFMKVEEGATDLPF